MKGLAWWLWLMGIAALAIGLSLSALGDGRLDDFIARIATVPIAATVGALILARVPKNPIGWIFLGVALLGGIRSLAIGYADYSLPSGAGWRALGETGAWISAWLWVPTTLVPVTFPLLLFPNGRLLSRRWRPFPWLAGVGIAAFSAFVALHPDAGDARWGLSENPYGLQGPEPILALLGLIGLAALAALLGSVAAVIVRFRRSQGEERQQLKWLAYGGAIAAAVLLVGGTAFDEESGVGAAIGAGLALVPVAIGIAILRYRLYDIDVVINRTLIYGALTATLGVAYLAGVLLFQVVLSPVTEDSGLAVAGSTLAVAALFRPARTRIQEAVDRRFYRRSYDAARTLEAFSARLRDDVDLDALSTELGAVVRETMQPAHVSLWLREAER